MTVDLMFNAVADHAGPASLDGERPDGLKSGWLNGIKHWQVDYTGAEA